jgi:hypothetical protein
LRKIKESGEVLEEFLIGKKNKEWHMYSCTHLRKRKEKNNEEDNLMKKIFFSFERKWYDNHVSHYSYFYLRREFENP